MFKSTSILTLLTLVLPGTLRAAEKVEYSASIRPILSKNCYHCHGADEHSRKADLRLDIREEALKATKEKAFPIKPGDPAGSAIIARICSPDEDEIMPPPKAGPRLTAGEVDLLRRWISEGAEFAEHWAFVKPTTPAVPKTDSAWPRSDLDRFILQKLTAAGLQPSPEVDRGTLARRVALDLTGLPPEPEMLNSFLADPSASAYETYVDKLLALPAYGERWARMWMDLARYADSAGYGSDPMRLNIWPYRDWVIQAFNKNLPYDQFSRAQLAGDLIPNTPSDQVVATAFHRNTMTNTEGGTDDEEWRVAAVKDRTHVTMQVWMGLTMGCAQCHTHKFDPISQKEFYETYAIFNQTADADRGDEKPTVPLPSADETARMEKLKQEIEALESSLSKPSPALEAEQAAWEEKLRQPVSWETLDVTSFKTPAEGTWGKQTDGSILIKGGVAPRTVYSLKAATKLRGITGLKLEALPDASLPNRGPGRASSGNAVVSEITVSAQPKTFTPPKAKFVRITAPGKSRILHFAEVQVIAGGKNIAPQGKASQSSTDFGGEAARAIDDNTDGIFTTKSTTHTSGSDNPWWEVDLGNETQVEEVALWNRTDGDTGKRIVPFKVELLGVNREVLWARDVTDVPAPSWKAKPADGSRPVTFSKASATFAQKGWPAGSAVDGDPKTGWAFHPCTGEKQTLVLQLKDTLDLGEGSETELAISLDQNYGEDHTLGRFRLSVTNSTGPLEAISDGLQAVLQKPREARTEAEAKTLGELFHPNSTIILETRNAIKAKQKELSEIKPVAVPVMQELVSGKQRKTHLLTKGNFLDPGETVQPGIPVAFGAWPKDAEQNRLGLTKWIFSPENPLTARVAVNRFWAQLFGTGIVETEEDFGTQGTLPSHRELLDWLALDFSAKGWDVKALLKTLVTSATYRQSSAVNEKMLKLDAGGRLLSHYPRRRLDAEQIRDQAMALSGLLSRKIGGPSVYPPQPDGLWKAAFNGERSYPTSTGEDRYRRGLYTVWRRSVPYPSMATFDAPSRESCTIRRIPTNTPLQAFVTLNDPVYVEAAVALGKRIRAFGGDPQARLVQGYKMVVCRDAKPAELSALLSLFNSELAKYTKKPDKAKAMTGMDDPKTAAWTIVANVLLNLDAVLMKS